MLTLLVCILIIGFLTCICLMAYNLLTAIDDPEGDPDLRPRHDD